MKLSDAIKYSYIKTIRDKKNIYFIIILVICCLLAMGAISFSTAFFSELKRVDDEDVSSRSLIIFPNIEDPQEAKEFMKKNISKVEEMEHVLEIPDNTGFVAVDVEQFMSPIHNGRIELIYGSEYTLPQNIIGKRFSSDDTGVAICPINFYPGDMVKYPKSEKEIFINGYDILNKTFEISKDMYDIIDDKVVKTGRYTKEFKVVGLYNSAETGGWQFQCYAPGEDIDEIYNASMSNLFSEEGEEITIPSATLIIDKYENTKLVMNELIKMGFHVNYVTERNEVYENNIKYTCAIIVIVAIISIIFLTGTYTKKKNLNNSYELGILKSIGYSDKDIIEINMIQISFMSFFSYLTSVIILLGGVEIIKVAFQKYLIYTQHSYYLNQYLATYIISLIMILLIPVISSIIYTKKLIKQTAIRIVKGDNL